MDRFSQGCETEFDRLWLVLRVYLYLEQWTFAQYSQKKESSVLKCHVHGDDLHGSPFGYVERISVTREKRT